MVKSSNLEIIQIPTICIEAKNIVVASESGDLIAGL